MTLESELREALAEGMRQAEINLDFVRYMTLTGDFSRLQFFCHEGLETLKRSKSMMLSRMGSG